MPPLPAATARSKAQGDKARPGQASQDGGYCRLRGCSVRRSRDGLFGKTERGEIEVNFETKRKDLKNQMPLALPESREGIVI
jgi:hypothetical protein